MKNTLTITEYNVVLLFNEIWDVEETFSNRSEAESFLAKWIESDNKSNARGAKIEMVKTTQTVEKETLKEFEF